MSLVNNIEEIIYGIKLFIFVLYITHVFYKNLIHRYYLILVFEIFEEVHKLYTLIFYKTNSLNL